VAAHSKVCVCGRWIAGFAGSNPVGGLDVCRDFCVLCGFKACATYRSLLQGSSTECLCVRVRACTHAFCDQIK